MADESTEQLVASLDVSITKLTKTLQKALGETDNFTKSNEGKHKASLERVERMYEQLELGNKLQVASTSGDQARVKALQEELELSRQIQRYRVAGLNTSDATAAAKAHMSALQAAEQAATGGLNRAQTMELTHVAKSLFDQISAGASPLRAMQVEGGRIAQIFSEGEGGVGGTFKALTGLINPMTIGIGGAVAAFAMLAIVAHQVQGAMEEVEQLKISGDKLGIPVEQLQLWQFIAAASHVSNDELNRSFEGLTVTLGKLKSGIREQRIQPFIQELGISDADIAKANNAADLMDLIVSKMDKIRDPSERLQAADAFGIGPAIPIIVKGHVELQALTDQFNRYAEVVTGPQAAAQAKLNDGLATAHALMHDKIRKDLMDLAPLVGSIEVAWDRVSEAVLGALGDMVKAASFKPGQAPAKDQPPKWVQGVRGAAHMAGDTVGGAPGAGLADLMTGIFSHLAGVDGSDKPNAAPPLKSKPKQPNGPTAAEIDRTSTATKDLTAALDQYVNHTSHAAEMMKRIADDRAAGAKVTPQQEASLMAAARAQDAKFGEGAARKAQTAANKALDELKASDDAISSAKKDELKARIALTGDLVADHQLKLQELAEERDRKNSDLARDAQTGKISAPAAAAATTANNGAYDAGVQLENRKFAETMADQARTYADDLRRYQMAHLAAMAALATSTQDWAADTRTEFALQQQSARGDFLAEINKRLNEAGEKHLTAEEAQAEIAAFDAGQADELSASNRSVDQAVAAKKREFADQLQGYVTSTLEAEASIATTAAQRRALEQRLLDIRQQQAREELERQIKAPGFTGDAGAARAGLAGSQAAEQSRFDDEHLSPWDAWAKEGQKASADVSTALQSGAVQGFNQLNSGIANAIVNGKSMGDVFKSVFRQMETDALQYLLRQAEIGAFGSGGLNLGGMLSTGFGLFGGGAGSAGVAAPAVSPVDLLSMGLPMFAGGTDDTPGGPTVYNEQGVEGYVPPGAQIIPNSTLKGLAKISDSVAAGGLGAPQAVEMHHHVSIDLTGANGDDAIAQAAHSAATAAYAAAISTSRSDLKRAQASTRRSLIG